MHHSLTDTLIRFWLAALVVSAVGCGSIAPIADASSADAAPPPDAPPPDAPPPDAPPVLGYEIAYINDMTFDPSGGAIDIAGFIVVINTGERALDLGTTKVLSFSDDSAMVGYTFSSSGNAETVLQPGDAAGELSPLAMQSIINSGLVTEPLVDTSYGFTMIFNSLPMSTLNLNAQAVLEIGGENIVLPFSIHFVPGSGTEFKATRIKLSE